MVNGQARRYNVYLIAKDGKIRAVITDLDNPNGIAFSPDEKTLYVVDWNGTEPQHLVVRGGVRHTSLSAASLVRNPASALANCSASVARNTSWVHGLLSRIIG
jgi:6-phosphogluconolactonase (cycloisomerase 2 family)